MVNEPTATTYSDYDLSQYIEARSVRDARGVDSVDWDYTTLPPTQTISPDWIPTYDINAAAADIWDEKASAVADCISFSADGASYSVNEKVANYNRMAAKYRSKSRIRSAKMVSKARETTPCGAVVERDTIVSVMPADDAVWNRS